jgi:WD40 repeat protein
MHHDGVLAGEPCNDHPAHAFCPFDFATTPDGMTLAMVSLSGEVQVWDVAGRRLLFDEPGIANRSSIGDIVVWLSPDGRLIARAVYNSGFTKPMAIISFQIWNIVTRQPLFHHGPTRSAPAAQISDVGLAPDGLLLTFVSLPTWYLFAHTTTGYVKVATYRTTESSESVSYVASRAEWFVPLAGGGYAIWKPSTTPEIIRVPCHGQSQISVVSGNGGLYACAAGGPDGPADFGNSVLIWDITHRVEVARLKDSRNIGNAVEGTFLNNGRSLAVLALPPHGLLNSGPQNLLLYSLGPHPAEQSVITLPGIPGGGWAVHTIGRFAVVIGTGLKYHAWCCLKAVMQPGS